MNTIIIIITSGVPNAHHQPKQHEIYSNPDVIGRLEFSNEGRAALTSLTDEKDALTNALDNIFKVNDYSDQHRHE